MKIYRINKIDMAKIRGNDLILFIRKEGEYKALAYSTTCEIDIQAGTIEVGSPDTGQWTRKKKKRKSWRASSGYLISDSVDVTDVFKTLVENESVSLMIGTVESHALSVIADEYVADGRLTMKGDGIITRLTITGKRGDFVTMSIDIEGVGALDIKIREWIVISPESIQADPLSSVYKVGVRSNTRWSFTIAEGSDFIGYEGKTQGKGNGSAVFKIDTNMSGRARTGTVKFVTENMEEAILKISQESVTPFVTIDEGSLSVVRQGGEYTIHVSANVDWRNDYHPDWVALSQESGGAGEFDVKVTVSPNTASESREDDIGFVTLIEGGEGANCVVTQTAEGDYLVLSSDNVTIGADGSGVSVGVQSNLQVSGLTLTSSEAWLMATEGSDTSIAVSASANTGESRTGSITVSTPSGITEVITVEQEAETAVTPYVRPTSNHVFFETAGEGNQLLELDTNVGIADISVMFIDDDWCACNLLESNGKIYVKIDVTENTDGYPRIGIISLELADGATETHAVAVGQMGTDSDVIACSQLIHIGPEFTVVQDASVPRSYTQTRFYVVSDNDWNVTSQDSFTLMDPTDGGLEAVPTMTEARLDISANSGSEIRAGEIVMEERYGAAATIYLTQGNDGLWIDLSGDDERAITNTSRNVAILCQTNLLASQFSSVSYEILDGGGDWMTLNSRNMSGTIFTHVFAVQANDTGNERKARILIKHANILPIVVTIIQQA